MTSPPIPSLLEQDDVCRDTEAFPKHTQSSGTATEKSATGKKRRNNRAGRKKKGRRPSFAVAEEDSEAGNTIAIHPSLDSRHHVSTSRPSFLRMGQSGGRALSESSLDSETLLDHG